MQSNCLKLSQCFHTLPFPTTKIMLGFPFLSLSSTSSSHTLQYLAPPNVLPPRDASCPLLLFQYFEGSISSPFSSPLPILLPTTPSCTTIGDATRALLPLHFLPSPVPKHTFHVIYLSKHKFKILEPMITTLSQLHRSFMMS